MKIQEYRNLTHDLKARAFFTALRTLGTYDLIELRRERDVHVVNATGEDVAPWEICVYTGKRRIELKADELDAVVILAEEQASVAYEEEAAARDAARNAALAKLTPEDRRVLNLG